MPAHLPRVLLAVLLLVVVVLGACRERGEAEAAGGPALSYTVQPGDTLVSIGAHFDVDTARIARANHLRSEELTPGMVLVLPGVTELPPSAPPAFEPQPAAPAPTVADTSWFVPRAKWAVEPIDTANTVPMTRIYRITVHHSGEEGDVVGDPVAALRHFEHIHKEVKHWACIGYHFIIASDGTIYEGRPLQYQGAHAVGDNNIGNIGICLIGDFDRQLVPQPQREALISLLDRLTQTYSIRKAEIFGHEEFKVTACPGKHLMPIVVAYRGVPAHPVRER